MPMNHLLNNFFSTALYGAFFPQGACSVSGLSNGDRLPDRSLWCELYGGVPRMPREKQRGECVQVLKTRDAQGGCK